MQRIPAGIAGAFLIVGGFMAVPAAGSEAASDPLSLPAAEQQLQELGGEVRSLRLQVAQAVQMPENYAAQVEVRLQDLERRLQELTGQIEELQFQSARQSDRLDRAVADIEYRLSQIEGGDAPPPPAAAAAPPPAAAPSQPPPPQRRPTGGTVDPQAGIDGTGTLGTLTFQTPPDGGAGTGPTRLGPSAPASAPTAIAPTTGNPDDDYQAAFRMLQRGDYAAAETALGAFVEIHGDHPLASNAYYWMGETYYVRGRYGDAAATFAQGFQRFPQGAKAVDNLLKLGMSLAALDRREDACVALTRVATEFPDGPMAVQRRAESEIDRLGCR